MRLSRRSFTSLLSLFPLATGLLPSLTAAKQAGTSVNTMRRLTPTDSSPTAAVTNGHAQRLCPSWIDTFVKHTDNLETPEVWRRWTAIVTVAAMMEQKCFMLTKSLLFPNLYAIIVGPPGVGKSRTIRVARNLVRPLCGGDRTQLHLAPDSMTGASLTDALVESRRDIPGYGDKATLTFNSMLLMPDELSDFMKVYDEALIGKLTKFYDIDPYTETRVVGKISRVIENSQLSMIAGSTTSHLLNKIPEWAWDQGFFSRTILIYAQDRLFEDDIFSSELRDTGELAHDLKCIFSLQGQFGLTDEYRQSTNEWRRRGELPKPSHPRFEHYNTRRLAHLLKLSMVSSADRGDDLTINQGDFERALAWLTEAEATMPRIFGTATSIDARVIDDTLHFIGDKELPGPRITRFIAGKVPQTQVISMMKVLEEGGMIRMTKTDRTGIKHYRRGE